MAIQEITNPSEKYLIRGWREGEGDPRIEIEVGPGDYHSDSVLSVADLAESIRSAALATPDVIAVEVRHVQVGGFTETVIPAP